MRFGIAGFSLRTKDGTELATRYTDITPEKATDLIESWWDDVGLDPIEAANQEDIILAVDYHAENIETRWFNCAGAARSVALTFPPRAVGFSDWLSRPSLRRLWLVAR